MNHCTSCKLEYPETSRFCKECGNQLSHDLLTSAACPSCGATLQSGWKFCKQCGHAFDEVTVVRSRSSQLPQSQGEGAAASTAGASAQTPAVTMAPVSLTPPTLEERCRICGHLNKPAAETCEGCGAPVGSHAEKLQKKKSAITASVSLVMVLLATGVVAAVWYALGIKVAIQTAPGNAKIVIDGQEVGRTNSYGSLTTPRFRVGDHSLAVVHEGYDEWRQSFSIAFTDWDKNLNVRLNATKYKLTVASSPFGSEVLVDNQSMGNTNDSNGILETSELAPGEHTVVVRHDGYHEWKQNVQLSGDQKLEVNLNPVLVYDVGSNADSEIRNTLEGWAQSTRNRDVDAHVRYYSDTLDYYYNRTVVPSSKIREDRLKAFAKFNYLSVQLSNMNIQLDSTGQRATVVLDKAFDFRGENNAFYNGSVQDQLTLTKLGGAWLITGEKELKVYYVNK